MNALHSSPEVRQLVLSVLDEQQASWQQGKPASVETYLDRHPSLRDAEGAILDLIRGEIVLREGRGERPQLLEYQQRFPQISERLQAQFDAHDRLKQMGIDCLPGTCPPESALEAMMSGKIEGPEFFLLSGHLEGCGACQEKVKSLSPTDTLVDQLRGDDEAARQIAAAIPQRLVEQVKNIAQLESKVDPQVETLQEDADGAPAVETDFLAPAQQPDEMGRLGPYRVLKVLGKGGMGMVFLGHDPHLDRQVALKVMLPRVAANDALKQRFLREARAAASLKSDHIVQIFHVGEERGVPYLAMELLEGAPLDAYLQGGRKLSLAQILRIGRETAKGLESAHEKGLIHRDIKPGNLWLDKTNTGRVKILDFGLARFEKEDVRVTQSGAILGTPTYMAPEQGSGNKVDHRADLWALGVILYEMTTGRRPFTGPNMMAVLTSLALDEPPPPATVDSKVPAPLSDLVMELLSKSPEKRPASARLVGERLRQIQLETTQVTADGSPDRGQSPVAIPVEKTAAIADLNVLPGAEVAHRPKADPGRGKRPPRKLVAIAAALVCLGVLAAGIVVIIRDKDGNKVAEHEVPPGGKVEVVDDGKEDGKPPKAADPDRRAAEYVLSIGGTVAVNDGDRHIKTVERLPEGPFRLTAVSLFQNTEVTDAGLAVLKECRNVTYLDLVSTGVSSAGLVHFQDWNNLLYLRLEGIKALDDAGLIHFKNCHKLTTLMLGHTRVTDAGLAHFKDCKNLTRLFLGNTRLTDAGLAHFKDCTNLGEISLYGTRVSDAGILPFKACKNLTSLFIHRTDVTAKGVEGLRQALPGCRIEWDGGVIEPAPSADPDRRAAEYVLSIGGVVGIDDDDELPIRDASKLPEEPFRLTTVVLAGNKQVTDAGLAHFHNCKNLKHLILSVTQVGDAGLTHFKDCKDLRTLILNATQLTNAGLGHFQGCANLESLDLSYTKVSDAGLAQFKDCKKLVRLLLLSTQVRGSGLVHFKDCTNLSELFLNGTRVSDVEVAYFKDCKNLTRLNLGITRVSDAGLAHFKGCVKLTYLHILGTNLTDAGLAHFKDCKELTSLHLGDTRVTDAGLAHLEDWPNLTELFLNATRVTDAGLNRLKECKSLTTLFLGKTQVTAKGVEGLRQALPGCRIEWDGGTIEPVPSAVPGRRADPFALEFDGVRSHVLLPDVGLNLVNPLTVEVWVTITALSDDQQLVFSGSALWLGSRNELWQFYGGNAQGAPPTIWTDEPATRNKWVHLAAVSDGSVRYLFVNGKRQARTARNQPARDFSTEMVLGAQRTPMGALVNLFKGRIRSVRISKTARYIGNFTPEQRFEPDRETLALYHIDEGEGDVLKDSSGNGHHGKIVGAKWVKVAETKAGPSGWVATPEQQQWLDSVARMTPQEQMEAVRKKLIEENSGYDGKGHGGKVEEGRVVTLGFHATQVTRIWPVRALRHLRRLHLHGQHLGRGKLADLSPLRGMELTVLMCHWCSVADLTPLQGMPLTELNVMGSPVRDLSPLKGMRLVSLNCMSTQVSDLAPLTGMPLETLHCGSTGISDLTPLRGMPLTNLSFDETQVRDLSPLKGMSLTSLRCGQTHISDLSVLEGMPLTELWIGSLAVSDLTLLRGMKLRSLDASGTQISDLSVLKGMPLTRIRFDWTRVADLSPLKGMVLTEFGAENTRVSDLTPLRGMPITKLYVKAGYFDPQVDIIRSLPCELLNGRFAPDFWKEFDARKAAAEKFVADCAKLPADELEKAVKARMEELNPRKIQAFSLLDEGGYGVTIVARSGVPRSHFDDLTPLLALPRLKKLTLNGGVPWLDLSPLTLTEIEEITCSEDQAMSNRLILAGIKTLRTINGKPAKEYLEEIWKKATE